MEKVVVGEVISRGLPLSETDNDYLNFHRDFDKRLDDLKDALARSKNSQALAAALKGRGTFQNFIGGMTGRNDQELAEMVGELGAGMEITQSILQMVMRVQNTKNRHLRAFHKSLIDKIAALQTDSQMLDSNQREAAIAIVSELSDQVSAQVRHHEIVESHQKKLGQQQRLIEALRDALLNRDTRDQLRTKRIDAQAAHIESLKLEAERQIKTILTLGQQHGALVKRFISVEKSLTDRQSLRSSALRAALPAAAIVISIISLICEFRNYF